VLDALLMEEQGVPAVALITEPFRPTAAAMAATWGLPRFRFLATPHPIATLADKDLDERAAQLAPLVLGILRGDG